MLRVHQVEDLHLVPVPAEQLRGVRVEFSFAVRDNGRLPPAKDVKQGWTDESPGLAGTRGPKHRNVPVEPGVRREAHGFAIALAQEDALHRGEGSHCQHLFQFFFPHPGGGAVGALPADGKAPGVLAAAAEPVTEFEISGEAPGNQQQNAHGFQPGEGEGSLHTNENIPAGRPNLCLPGYAAGLVPRLIVLQQLGQKAT